MFLRAVGIILGVIGFSLTLLGIVKLIEGMTVNASLVVPSILLSLLGIIMVVLGVLLSKLSK